MPELPEVETVCRGVGQRITGYTIEQVHLNRADVVHGAAIPLCAALHGRRIKSIERVGKQIIIVTDGAVALMVHLGMTGKLIAVHPEMPIEPHTHLRIGFRGRKVELRFVDPRRFGGIWLLGADSSRVGWIGRQRPSVGPDALTVSCEEFARRLARRRQIKALLLDQQVLGGVGNIYCDESLHRAGLHPAVRADRLSIEQIRRLYRTIRSVLAQAIKAGGSSISDYRNADNAPGRFQVRHRVYDREGQPCRRCKTAIRRLVVAGRGTFICPKCQPGPRVGSPRPLRRQT
ncbi:MAG TPA: bifunctional DNA-formamidopyrimidine glycosylase/DNA-(apurinic or apyrimidinic site) lyase [Phycisphaerae bacterium]|nr:bifunctional DNA-formamidopyrimidine glycosylase/DNA-(apurinic or apyrimidinic site) lyase [Phycisphaerae bacterium]HRR83752.1 bifunctional DNA-formamidopyrimidine glycosylase/DNA-(apurinic or apyrimidinic site) lyase [Phycisphaerae bacterium]